MTNTESRISRWLRRLARNGTNRIRTTPNSNNNATKEFNLLLLSDEGDPDFVLEERSRLLIQSGCFVDAVAILETTSISQGQQLLLGECYFELGRYLEGLQCSARLVNMLTTRPRPAADDLMKLVEAYLASSYDFRSLLLLRCVAKLYALEAEEDDNAIRSLRSIEKCSYECFCLVDSMIEHKGYHQIAAKEYGPEFMIEMLDLSREIKSSNSKSKVELEANILNNLGLCYRCIKCHVAATRYLQEGVSLIKDKEVSTISYYKTLGKLLRNLGLIMHDEQKYCEAQSFYIQSLDAFGKAEKLRMKHSSISLTPLDTPEVLELVVA